MTLSIYHALFLGWFIIWFIIALPVPQALLGHSVQHGHHPLIHATFTCLFATPCPHTALHYLCLPASHINPLPCLEDREALHTGDEDAMLSQKAIFPSPLKLAIMALTWKFWRKCKELSRIGRMNCLVRLGKQDAQWSDERINGF